MSVERNRFEAHPILSWTLLAIVVLGLAEGLLQVFFYAQQGYSYFSDPYQISYVTPVPDRREYALAPDHRSQLYSINQQGYRGPVVPGHSPDILVMGDSVPFGANVRDDETYAAYLSSEFGLHVINGGVPSYSLWQSVYRWREDFKEQRPAVVTLQSANDVSLLSWYQDDWNDNRTWYAIRWQDGGAFLGRSAMLHYARVAFERAFAGNAREQVRAITSQPLQDRFFASVRQTLEEAAALAAARHATLVLIPINPFYYLNDLDRSRSLRLWRRDYREFVGVWNDLYERVNTVMKEVASSHPAVVYFDVVAVMDGQDRNAMFVDFIHLSPEGHRFVARSLHDFITSHHLLVAGVSR